MENLPEYISDAKEALLKIPCSFEATYIPQDELVVNQFIKKDIPTQSAELWPIKAADCFSPNNPTIAWDMLAWHTAPSSQILTTLESALDQAWFDGAKSVIGWRYRVLTFLGCPVLAQNQCCQQKTNDMVTGSELDREEPL